MELQTVMLMLAVGSFIFGLLLIAFKFNKSNLQQVPFWVQAKILQAIGSLLLYLKTDNFDVITLLAYLTLLLGCAYESWAVSILSGNTVKRRYHIPVSAGIILACLTTLFIGSPMRSGVIFLLQSFLYLLPAIFLMRKAEARLSLKYLMAACYCITAAVFLAASVICFVFPNSATGLAGQAVFNVIPITSFFIFLTSGFILLMLAKERSDMLVRQMQKSLKESEIRFRFIVESSIEGIIVFDENYKIIYANKNMASSLGYSVEELKGKNYHIFIPEDQAHIFSYQESLRKKGEDSVYECCLLKKDGSINWFLVSAKAIMDESGNFDGSFAMFTDINSRKMVEMQLEESNRYLTELSNMDSLTGIANRRCFDTVLKHECSKYKLTKSRLSIIIFDIDYFKEYNDYYGHVAGDECLRRIGGVLELCLGGSINLAARYGGEEFACILPDTDINMAQKTAEMIRTKIQELEIEHKRSSVSGYITASFGVATAEYPAEISPEDIVSLADKMLYKAKEEGRNRIESIKIER